MSDHDATVRRFLYPGYISTPSGWKEAHDALDALVAERDHYRAALEHLHSPGRRQDIDQGRGLTHYIRDALLHGEALAGDTECVCGEINTRHCPVHGQGDTE